MQLDQIIEGVLFYKACPVKRATLITMLGTDEAACGAALETLAARLQAGATRLIMSDSEVALVTAPELDELIESLRKDDLKRDIGKAGAETLAIILYKGPLQRSEIDRIRGVNSNYILRNLQTRGLIEKTGDGKQPYYAITSTLLAHLGITHKEALPHFAHIMKTLDEFESRTV